MYYLLKREERMMKRLLQTQLAVLAGLILLLGSPSTSVANGAKVKICHLNHTISVSEKALQTHLKHGDTRGPCAVLPTQTSKRETVVFNEDGETCVIKVFVDSDGCVTDIDSETCPSFDEEEFTVQIGDNPNTIAAGCDGNATFPGSFRYCWPNAAGSMTCITF